MAKIRKQEKDAKDAQKKEQAKKNDAKCAKDKECTREREWAARQLAMSSTRFYDRKCNKDQACKAEAKSKRAEEKAKWDAQRKEKMDALGAVRDNAYK